ncbi:lysoplasmalogenase [Flavobacterium piscinae]|uniref:Lysoplasmalogenase n=1 Tax=Flavobacterium piscinae TaxID=2506424 RepID=A0A4Q1KNW4_9FLAO|nr:lysoplasmalogenase [Flavobacterium piscinae]MBC8884467.1 lysoplasmalogenase [Flavobacterium piscinae]RXR31721.1 lysoplasmalogenase [Flavobacterium piscinae]
MKVKNYTRSFAVIAICYLILLITNKEEMAWWLKPLLVPFLISIVAISDKFKTQKILLLALFFSWIGDVLLMFTNKNVLFFISGLIVFLIAHLAFIFLFNKQNKNTTNKNYLQYIPLVGIYLFAILSLLWSSLNEMKIPVTIYALVISIMLLMSIKAYFEWKKPANLLVLIGVLLFVISDSILAINKFYTILQFSSFLIMSTYLGAQYFIVKSILTNNKV